jgi:hypothetical protein
MTCKITNLDLRKTLNHTLLEDEFKDISLKNRDKSTKLENENNK